MCDEGIVCSEREPYCIRANECECYCQRGHPAQSIGDFSKNIRPRNAHDQKVQEISAVLDKALLIMECNYITTRKLALVLYSKQAIRDRLPLSSSCLC